MQSLLSFRFRTNARNFNRSTLNHSRRISFSSSVLFAIADTFNRKSLPSTYSMPPNTAAWLTAEKAYPLEVKSAPYVSPGEKEIVVKPSAVALNLVDWARQEMGSALFNWTKYPAVLGSDIAGEVIEVGSGVSRFKPGDRVLGHADELLSNNPNNGAFQSYVLIEAHMVSHIPEGLSFENASVIPLGVSTAACGLFQKDFLSLQHPSSPAKPPTGETLLVWSGSSSVGSNAIQLAIAAGYEVVTTASPKNFDFVKKLGASQAFDYHSPTIVDQLVDALKDKTMAGAIAIGTGAPDFCVKIIEKCKGKKFVATANPPSGELSPDVGFKFIFGSSLKITMSALADGTFIPAPDAEVVGHGLESIQAGLDTLKKGVSAKKLVISL